MLEYIVGIPMYYHGVRTGLALFFLGNMACGELLATIFIANHVTKGVSYGYAKKDPKGVVEAKDDKSADRGDVEPPGCHTSGATSRSS